MKTKEKKILYCEKCKQHTRHVQHNYVHNGTTVCRECKLASHVWVALYDPGIDVVCDDPARDEAAIAVHDNPIGDAE